MRRRQSPGAARRGKYLGKSELCPEAAGGAAWHRRPLTALLLQVRSAKIKEGDGAGGGSAVAQEGEPLPMGGDRPPWRGAQRPSV